MTALVLRAAPGGRSVLALVSLALLGVIQRIDLKHPAPVSVEEMLDAAELAAPRLATLLTGLIERMGGDPRTSACPPASRCS